MTVYVSMLVWLMDFLMLISYVIIPLLIVYITVAVIDAVLSCLRRPRRPRSRPPPPVTG